MFINQLWLVALTATAVAGIPLLQSEDRSAQLILRQRDPGPADPFDGALEIDPASPEGSLYRRAANPDPASGNEPSPQTHFNSLLTKRNEPDASPPSPDPGRFSKPLWENPNNVPDFEKRQKKLIQIIRDNDVRYKEYGNVPFEPHVEISKAEIERLRLLQRGWVEECLAKDPSKSLPECVLEARVKLRQQLHAEAWERERVRQLASSSSNPQQQQQQKQSKDQGPSQFSLPAVKKGLENGYNAVVRGGVEATGQMSQQVKDIKWGAVAATVQRGVTQGARKMALVG